MAKDSSETIPLKSEGSEGIESKGSTNDTIQNNLGFDRLPYNEYHPKPIRTWARGIAIQQTCHSYLAEKFRKYEQILATTSVFLTALTSSAIFTSISPLGNQGANTNNGTDDTTSTSSFSVKLSAIAGTIAALNTILQAVHKHLQFASRSEQHFLAFKRFTKIRFQLESLAGDKYRDDGKLNEALLKDWIDGYGEVLESAPNIPQEVFKRFLKEELRHEMTYFKVDEELQKSSDQRENVDYSTFSSTHEPAAQLAESQA